MPTGSIHRCMIALLDNALRYSPPGATITLSLDPARSFVWLSVRDQGPGILGIEPARIFDRFARADAAAGSNESRGPGFGMPSRVTEARHPSLRLPPAAPASSC
jgi:two-component system OmpR family sensor kinase